MSLLSHQTQLPLYTKRIPKNSAVSGIKLKDHKALSNTQTVRLGPLPERLIFPLAYPSAHQKVATPHSSLQTRQSQTVQRASIPITNNKPVVKIGQYVCKGELLSVAQNSHGLNSHASSSGTVTHITDFPIAHPWLPNARSIILETDGLDQDLPLTPLSQPFEHQSQVLLQHLHKHGIGGMGGAGYACSEKAKNTKNHTLILNAAECEPYLTTDEVMLCNYSTEILDGCRLLAHAAKASHLIIAIEDNKAPAIAALEQALNHFKPEPLKTIELLIMPHHYPSGGEKQLYQQITGKEIPSGTYLNAHGYICYNVATVFAAQQALRLGTPCIERTVTITGLNFTAQQRGNYQVRIGTPINELLNAIENVQNQDKIQTFSQASYSTQQVTMEQQRLIYGGPMMGFALNNLQAPIVKTSQCLIAPGISELPLPKQEQACIRCGQCEPVCPSYLLPQQLLWHSKNQYTPGLEQYNLFDCIECGACQSVCPSHIPLVNYYRQAKTQQLQQKKMAQTAQLARQRFEAKQARQQKESQQHQSLKDRLGAENLQALLNETKHYVQNSTRKKSSTRTQATQHGITQEPYKQLETKNTHKTQYLKAQKRFKEAQKAWEKAQKKPLSDQQKQRYNDKIAALQEQVEAAKAQWNKTQST